MGEREDAERELLSGASRSAPPRGATRTGPCDVGPADHDHTRVATDKITTAMRTGRIFRQRLPRRRMAFSARDQAAPASISRLALP